MKTYAEELRERIAKAEAALAAKERECAMLREMYSFESRSSKKFIREMLKKAAAGGEVTK